jgi:hypothetical protein
LLNRIGKTLQRDFYQPDIAVGRHGSLPKYARPASRRKTG